jgi:hypothetical protein
MICHHFKGNIVFIESFFFKDELLIFFQAILFNGITRWPIMQLIVRLTTHILKIMF